MKTKNIIFLIYLFLATLCFSGYSQQIVNVAPNLQTVAFINSSELLDEMPEKATAAEQVIKLNESYKAEFKLMENEYNKKYSDFITYQGSMAENIKLRRMQELTELEQKMNDFMQLAQKDIEAQEQKLLVPLKQKLNDVIRTVGIEHNFTVIYDISNSGIAFVTPKAIDATPLVRKKLQIEYTSNR